MAEDEGEERALLLLRLRLRMRQRLLLLLIINIARRTMSTITFRRICPGVIAVVFGHCCRIRVAIEVRVLILAERARVHCRGLITWAVRGRFLFRDLG